MTFCVRSPLATAVVTCAIWRTWSVRLDAITFTDSVRSLHVPETSETWAWPPSSPSVPTSRATRVTSSPKEDSRATIALIVRLSSSTSPRASTVTCWVRSPLATAVVTCAIWRTCSVRFAAMTFTESVRSRHVPLTPLTSAWPPSLPSVPTSRATRVTSSAKEPSWSTIAFTVWPIRLNSPLTGWPSIVSAIFWERSPWATAAITRPTSVVGRTRSSTSELTASTLSAQPPYAPGTRRALGHPAVAADDPREALDLPGHPQVLRDELVHAGLHVADHVAPARGQLDREIPVAGGGERGDDRLERLLVGGVEP